MVLHFLKSLFSFSFINEKFPKNKDSALKLIREDIINGELPTDFINKVIDHYDLKLKIGARDAGYLILHKRIEILEKVESISNDNFIFSSYGDVFYDYENLLWDFDFLRGSDWVKVNSDYKSRFDNHPNPTHIWYDGDKTFGESEVYYSDIISYCIVTKRSDLIDLIKSKME